MALVLVIGAAGWAVTGTSAPPDDYAALTGDAEAGRVTFALAGCASCHVDPEADHSDRPVLSGGRRFASDFGVFVAPNISPSPQGIGDWTDTEIMHAIHDGVSPTGAHYYPAFPYGSYNRAEPQDLADLVAFLRTLPPSDAASAPHEVSFPFSIRRAVGAWKLLFLSDEPILTDPATDQIARGRYLVEGLGHCGECHTPRNALGGLDHDNWLAGAENPGGEGRIPNITPGALNWSEADIVAYLDSGFTPEFDVAGGEMADVVLNTAQLSDEDRAAIAAYLKAVPAID
nr:cytochrome c [Roseisalinus antarcticus]